MNNSTTSGDGGHSPARPKYVRDPAIAAEVATWPPLTPHQRSVVAAAFQTQPAADTRTA